MGTTRLDALPNEIREKELYPRTPLSALGFLAQTAKQYEAETTFLRLLQASIHAAPEFLDANKDATALAAIAILKKHPELLFRKMKVTDHYGRVILASPYQIFLGAGDVWALRQIHSDILPLIKKNGEDEKDGQEQAEVEFRKQFPNCPWPIPQDLSEEMLHDDRNKQQIEEVKKQLAIVKQHMDVDPFSNNKPLDTTQQAIKTLCELFQPKPGEVIRSGLHFPPAIIKEVYKTYNALQGHWSFFSLAVIKPAFDALSTVDGQCCQGGLINLDSEKGPSRRCHPSYKYPLGKPLSLTFVNDKEKRGVAALVDPYDGDVLFVSPKANYYDWFNKSGWPRGLHTSAGAAAGELCFGKLMENKSRSLWELLCSQSQRNQHTVTMSMTARGNVWFSNLT
jgi:hypothetical protein